MRQTLKYDTEATLTEICSREDFQYKRSLRNTISPVFVPETGKYDVRGVQTGARQRGKLKPQLTPVEIAARQLRREEQEAMLRDRIERMANTRDKFARLAEKENRTMPCISDMAEKKLVFDGPERNKLTELNYLLHRKRETGEDSSRLRSASRSRSPSDLESGFKRNREVPSSYKKRASTAHTQDQSHSKLPFLIGDTRVEDEIILEGTEDIHRKSGEIEVVKYDRPNQFESCSNEELLALIDFMEKEIYDLNKDLDEERRKKGTVNTTQPPLALLQKMKTFLIRNIWDLNDVKNDVAEKDRRLANLNDIIRRFDPTLAKQVSKAEGELSMKLFDRANENESLLRLVEDLIENYDKEAKNADSGVQSRQTGLTSDEYERLRDQMEAVKAENELLSDFFRQFRAYDDSIVKLNNKQMVEKGSKLSIELLLRSLDRQTTELTEKDNLLKRHQEDFISLQKKLAQLEEIHFSSKLAFEKGTQSLLQLLLLGQEKDTELPTDQNLILRAIREKITSLKMQNEEAISKSSILSQMEKVKDDEIKDLREKLLTQTHQIETMALEKAQTEEKLRFSEIEKNNLQDLQFSSEEELKRRLKAESKKTIDDLNEKVKNLTQKVTEQEKTIHSLASQLNMPVNDSGIDKDTVKLVFDELTSAAYQQEVVSAFDTKIASFLEGKIGHENTNTLINYDVFVGRYKYNMNLLESLYQENVTS